MRRDGEGSNRARLAQQRLASGGQLSAQAAAELGMMGQEDINQQLFDAWLGVDSAETQMGLENSNRLQDRMLGIEEMVLGSNERERALGLSQMLASLELRYKRNKAIADSVMSGISMGMGG